MNDAVLSATDPRAVLRFERVLPQPPHIVWKALTSRDELTAWFPSDVIVERWEAGQTITFEFREHHMPSWNGVVLEADPPRTLAFTWGEETLRFELHDLEGATRLILTDELDRPIAARNAAGWDVCLDRLGGIPDDREGWQPRFDHYVSVFEPVLGAQEGPPSGA